jgi:hypothetical protein
MLKVVFAKPILTIQEYYEVKSKDGGEVLSIFLVNLTVVA